MSFEAGKAVFAEDAGRDFGVASAAVLRRLNDLQYGVDAPVLMFTQDPTGLGAQISRRLLGLRLALMFGRKVVFPHLTEPPYEQVFEPVHTPFDYEGHRNSPEFDWSYPQMDPACFLDFWRLWGDDDFRERATRYVPDALRPFEQSELLTDGVLLKFCRLTCDNASFVDQAQQRLGVGSSTLGVHVRRGDKRVESPYVPVHLINEAIASHLRSGEFTSVFVATDDPEVIREIVLPRNVELMFDSEERRYNNANHKFLMANPALAREETLTAIKNISLLGACGAVIGQTNAHFATLAAAQIYARTGHNRSTLIDGQVALSNSAGLRVLYRFQSFARAFAKKLFPQLTIRNRMRAR